MARLSVPTTGPLSSTVRIHKSNAIVQKIVGRLSRPALLSLALDWLDENNQSLCAPQLGGSHDPNDFYPPAESLQQLRRLYRELQARKGSKKDVVDRVLEGDWRHGLSLYQLAMADVRYLHEHQSSLNWMAYRLALVTPRRDGDEDNDDSAITLDRQSLDVPRFHPSTFLQTLQSQILPDVKVHYHLDRPPGLALLLVRLFIVDSPYTSAMALDDGTSAKTPQIESSRTLYIAFPDAAPFVYLSKPQSTGIATGADSKVFRNLVEEGIPKALSQPRKRYTLQATDLRSKNLSLLLSSKGAGRTNAAAGGWSFYADRKKNESPLDPTLPTPPLSEDSESVSSAAGEQVTAAKRKVTYDPAEADRIDKKARLLAARARFGGSAKLDDGRGIERVDITMEDSFLGPENNVPGTGEDETSWAPSVKLTFRGSHVFAGMRQLVEAGVVDGSRMPGWLTGEEGVTIGVVRDGRIRGFKGSGL
ncbi:hypothetical protein D7B24_003612 [Verticillium nonalfalfae]|uniref:CHL4-domain-containing protein n=1 Tax=Verticillium nonalfalfae TaxID=1051616 RepID=A0A3M9YIY9_9PEZI|nr:uncharacterized protein D7B24_003612 [Verticillium nonalfalfae]RNJ59060.1 hypothetical protein D7B24_003612 [Verticillium nonalfalfae]